MKVSTIQISLCDSKTNIDKITFYPRRIKFEVQDIQDIVPAKEKIRVFRSKDCSTQIKEILHRKCKNSGYIPIFCDNEYLKFHELYDEFKRDLMKIQSSKYKKLAVSKVHFYKGEIDDIKENRHIPYIDIPKGSLVRIKKEKEYRRIICSKSALASNVFDCLIFDKHYY